jgi:hypothetical protein
MTLAHARVANVYLSLKRQPQPAFECPRKARTALYRCVS